MKTSYVQQIVLVAFILIVLGCSSDTGGGGTTFIPSFNATWPVEGDENYELDLQPDEATQKKPAGDFKGTEFHFEDDARNNNPIEGSFDGRDIKFTINRKNGDKINYSGKMTPTSETDPFIIKITLNSPQEGTLILSR